MLSCRCTESGLETEQLQTPDNTETTEFRSYILNHLIVTVCPSIVCLVYTNVTYVNCAAVTFLLSYLMYGSATEAIRLNYVYKINMELSGPERVLCG